MSNPLSEVKYTPESMETPVSSMEANIETPGSLEPSAPQDIGVRFFSKRVSNSENNQNRVVIPRARAVEIFPSLQSKLMSLNKRIHVGMPDGDKLDVDITLSGRQCVFRFPGAVLGPC